METAADARASLSLTDKGRCCFTGYQVGQMDGQAGRPGKGAQKGSLFLFLPLPEPTWTSEL